MLLIVGISRVALLKVFQIPALVILPLTFFKLFPQGGEIFLWGYFLCGLVVVAQFSYFGEYLPKVFPLHLRGTGGSFATNVGGRMIGTSMATLNTSWLAPLLAGGVQAVKPMHVALAAGYIATAMVVIAFVVGFLLPEPKAERHQRLARRRPAPVEGMPAHVVTVKNESPDKGLPAREHPVQPERIVGPHLVEGDLHRRAVHNGAASSVSVASPSCRSDMKTGDVHREPVHELKPQLAALHRIVRHHAELLERLAHGAFVLRLPRVELAARTVDLAHAEAALLADQQHPVAIARRTSASRGSSAARSASQRSCGKHWGIGVLESWSDRINCKPRSVFVSILQHSSTPSFPSSRRIPSTPAQVQTRLRSP